LTTERNAAGGFRHCTDPRPIITRPLRVLKLRYYRATPLCWRLQLNTPMKY